MFDKSTFASMVLTTLACTMHSNILHLLWCTLGIHPCSQIGSTISCLSLSPSLSSQFPDLQSRMCYPKLRGLYLSLLQVFVFSSVCDFAWKAFTSNGLKLLAVHSKRAIPGKIQHKMVIMYLYDIYLFQVVQLM